MTGDDEPFFRRWSRRKHAARRGVALPESPLPAGASAAGVPAQEGNASVSEPAAELPPLDSLKGLESDYKAFMGPRINTAMRAAALKKLFQDRHFNQMDGLDVYIDDYSKAETLPSTTVRLLNQARNLGLSGEDKEEGTIEPEAVASAEGTAGAVTEEPPAESPPVTDGEGPTDESPDKKPDAA